MRIGRTPIGIMICACSLFALGLTACGGGDPPDAPKGGIDPIDPSGCRLNAHYEAQEQSAIPNLFYEYTYTPSDTTISEACEDYLAILGCTTVESCVEDVFSQGEAGEMTIWQLGNKVAILIENTVAPIPLVLTGEKTGASFFANLDVSFDVFAGCSVAIEANMSGHNGSEPGTLSGNVDARVSTSNCGVGMPENRSMADELHSSSPEDELAPAALILRALFLIE